jgi:hypothetical protein
MTAPSLIEQHLVASVRPAPPALLDALPRRRFLRRRTSKAAAAALAAERIVLREAREGDAGALELLQELDAHRLPAGRSLVAEADGRLIAAADLSTGEIVADPFVPSAAVRDLLRLRAAQLRMTA